MQVSAYLCIFETVLRYNPVNKGQKHASGKTTHCVRKGTPP
nr:MAG TPA: hypothetical protein [Caudoviricetes sp.]